jgi:hypothetical protein
MPVTRYGCLLTLAELTWYESAGLLGKPDKSAHLSQ